MNSGRQESCIEADIDPLSVTQLDKSSTQDHSWVDTTEVCFYSNQHIKDKGYPIRSNRYFTYGWNYNAQSCYTDDEIQLLSNIKDKYSALIDKDKEWHFEIETEKRIYDWWVCQKPKYNLSIKQLVSSFTLPNREARDSTFYPLWHYSENMAKKIANWQSQRVKGQPQALSNDPVMLVFEELKNWFFNDLSERGNKKEDIDYIAKRQNYIKSLIHFIPNYGLDRFHLHEIQNSLETAQKSVSNFLDNKQLPMLLSDIIIKELNLENIIGTYLHFLLINEEVSDNYSYNLDNLNSLDCSRSPICKVYHSALLSKKSITDDVMTKLESFNLFYEFNKIKENDGIVQVHFQLKDNLLNSITFSSFVTFTDKNNYLEALAMLDAMSNIRKTLNEFKNVQLSIGTYDFAVNYADKISSLANNYINLINRSQIILEKLLKSANKGLATLLKSNHILRKKEKYFERNLNILETKISKETTISNQLNDYCSKAKESMYIYQNTMRKLVLNIDSKKTDKEIEYAMQSLMVQINHMNTLLKATMDGDKGTFNLHSEMYSVKKMQMLEDDHSLKPNSIKDKYQLATMPIFYEEGRWDKIVKEDPINKQSIFIYRLYKHDLEVGSAEFYGVPWLCFSSDKKQHNLIALSGILRNITISPDMPVEHVCHYLPPSLMDKIIYSANRAAMKGFLRGGSTMVKIFLKAHGVKSSKANVISYLSYYTSIFSMNYLSYYYQLNEETSIEKHMEAFYMAAWQTGNLVLVELAFEAASKLVEKSAALLANSSWNTLSNGLKKVSNVVRYGMFAYQAVSGGIIETTTALLSGSATEILTEKAGCYAIKKWLT